MCLKQYQAEEDKPKYLQLLQTDMSLPEASTSLRQLLLKYNLESTAAGIIVLPKPTLTHFIPIPARITGQISSPPCQYLTSSISKYYMQPIHRTSTEIYLLE
ncbi:unnamed protein product [Rotaria sp. Silwood1]|nr:unnamed protein product [Rotaria sp. Silwood1]CAF1641988.1 unnamed protein product [Rotaria sp. Silwood1]CAF3784338.1 unnamed protein product [Rotaria sp. Silwood1]CAF3826623.1 unnamed protein product [Rotaria sp. Silwood1]CAF3838197.1 unnamed protein product [Rotaria sp. Silwood1]